MPKPNDVVRTNPLPPGKYWVVVTGLDDIAKFDAWLMGWTQADALKTNSTEVLSRHGDIISIANLPLLLSPILGAAIALKKSSDPDQNFYTFTVTKPGVVVWDTTFGLPSVAADSVITVDQVEQAPPPTPDLLDRATEAINQTSVTKIVVVGAIAIGLFFLAKEFVKEKARGE